MENEKIEKLRQLLSDILINDNSESVHLVSSIAFNSENLDGKGILWIGKGYNKQFIFASNPDRFFISENLDIAKGKNIFINNTPVLSENSLGNTVTKSHLKEVGRLKGLLVDGSVKFNDHLIYDSVTNRLGIGTEDPKSSIDICENNVEILIGSHETNVGCIGTYNSQDFSILTDNTTRITVSANGNIILGNINAGPVNVKVIGTLSINVNTPDSRANLHVNGPIKYNNKLHISGSSIPSGGSYSEGDICWHTEPHPGGHIGWVCIRAGNPGVWHPFGRID